jgi:DnaJ-domain-containing protein 1
MDMQKKMLVACVLLTQADGSVQRQVRTFSTRTAELLTCLDWLESLQIEIVAMESTGV